mmetsp:Transcript_25603/g.75554  ORF Transcript_25603/g.75554 Transcript_25603/m.75554 type:complete len:211 (-) Transcript_25603:508-1140(-)
MRGDRVARQLERAGGDPGVPPIDERRPSVGHSPRMDGGGLPGVHGSGELRVDQGRVRDVLHARGGLVPRYRRGSRLRRGLPHTPAGGVGHQLGAEGGHGLSVRPVAESFRGRMGRKWLKNSIHACANSVKGRDLMAVLLFICSTDLLLLYIMFNIFSFQFVSMNITSNIRGQSTHMWETGVFTIVRDLMIFTHTSAALIYMFSIFSFRWV